MMQPNERMTEYVLGSANFARFVIPEWRQVRCRIVGCHILLVQLMPRVQILLRELFGDGILGSNEDTWRAHRKSASPMFAVR